MSKMNKLLLALISVGLVQGAFAQSDFTSQNNAVNELPVLGVVSKTNAQKIEVKAPDPTVKTNIVIKDAAADANSTPVVSASAPTVVSSAAVQAPAKAEKPIAAIKPVKVALAKENVAQAQTQPAPIKLKALSSVKEEIILPPPPPKAIEGENMPGIGFMPGENPDLKNKVIKTGSERNEISYISATFFNRIATPFKAPRVIDQSDADIKQDGSDIYIKPASTLPIAIFIVDDVSHQTISMTLVPKNLPSQTLVAQIQTQSISADKNEPIPEEYIAKLTNVNLQAAQQKLPSGFTEARMPNSITRMGNLVVTPLTRYSGSSYDIYKYEIASGYQNDIELKEEAFFNDQNIRTISFFPATTLSLGQKTYMFVVSDKPKSEKNKGLSF
jgi:conjugal transfer pilus assembly protein TraK